MNSSGGWPALRPVPAGHRAPTGCGDRRRHRAAPVGRGSPSARPTARRGQPARRRTAHDASGHDEARARSGSKAGPRWRPGRSRAGRPRRRPRWPPGPRDPADRLRSASPPGSSRRSGHAAAGQPAVLVPPQQAVVARDLEQVGRIGERHGAGHQARRRAGASRASGSSPSRGLRVAVISWVIPPESRRRSTASKPAAAHLPTSSAGRAGRPPTSGGSGRRRRSDSTAPMRGTTCPKYTAWPARSSGLAGWPRRAGRSGRPGRRPGPARRRTARRATKFRRANPLTAPSRLGRRSGSRRASAWSQRRRGAGVGQHPDRQVDAEGW